MENNLRKYEWKASYVGATIRIDKINFRFSNFPNTDNYVISYFQKLSKDIKEVYLDTQYELSECEEPVEVKVNYYDCLKLNWVAVHVDCGDLTDQSVILFNAKTKEYKTIYES